MVALADQHVSRISDQPKPQPEHSGQQEPGHASKTKQSDSRAVGESSGQQGTGHAPNTKQAGNVAAGESPKRMVLGRAGSKSIDRRNSSRSSSGSSSYDSWLSSGGSSNTNHNSDSQGLDLAAAPPTRSIGVRAAAGARAERNKKFSMRLHNPESYSATSAWSWQGFRMVGVSVRTSCLWNTKAYRSFPECRLIWR